MKKSLFKRLGIFTLGSLMPLGFAFTISCSSIKFPTNVFYDKKNKEIHIEINWSDNKFWSDRVKAYHLQQAVNKEIANTIKSIPKKDLNLFKEHFFNVKNGVSKDFIMDFPYFHYKRMKSKENLNKWKEEYQKKYEQQWGSKTNKI